MAKPKDIVLCALRAGAKIEVALRVCYSSLEARLQHSPKALLILNEYKSDPIAWDLPLQKEIEELDVGVVDPKVLASASEVLDNLRASASDVRDYLTRTEGDVGVLAVGERQTVSIVNQYGEIRTVPLRTLLEGVSHERKRLNDETRLLELCQQMCTKLVYIRRIDFDYSTTDAWRQLDLQWHPECSTLISKYVSQSVRGLTAGDCVVDDAIELEQTLTWLTALRDAASDLTENIKHGITAQTQPVERPTAAIQKVDLHLGLLLQFHVAQVAAALQSLSNEFESMTVKLHH